MRRPLGSIATSVTEWHDGCRRSLQDDIVREEPLEIRVASEPLALTMRTPGHDLELTAGFLFAEGVIDSADQLTRFHHAVNRSGTQADNVVEVELRADRAPAIERLRRTFPATSACGVCGKASIEALHTCEIRRPAAELAVDVSNLCSMPAELRSEQTLFSRTGGLHAAALFDADGRLVVSREDVGRHNAVDKLIGRAILDRRVPLSTYILLVSGRAGFEIVQKALVAGVPIVASISAPTSLAVQLARDFGQTLIGFLRDRRFVVYSGEDRLLSLTSAVSHLEREELQVRPG